MDVPDVDKPDVDVSDVDEPDVDVPNVDELDVNVPDVDVSDVDWPDVDVDVKQKFQFGGVGALLGYATYESGSLQLIVSSIAAMVIFILIVNRFLWQPAYHLAQKRFVRALVPKTFWHFRNVTLISRFANLSHAVKLS